jgi:1-acyl-sn-glycerol-3-phosphate acyltransferase
VTGVSRHEPRDRHMRGRRRLASLLARTMWSVHVHGAGRVPRSGPVILAANHLSLLDGPLVFATADRAVRFLAKRELYVTPLAWLLHWSGQIPVDRHRPDRQAMRACLQVLADGGALGVFPEGTRGEGNLDRIHHGVAYLALKSGATVVPVACQGTRRRNTSLSTVAGFRSHVDVAFGVPFHVTATGDASARRVVAAAAEEIRARMRAHLADTAATCRGAGDEVPA